MVDETPAKADGDIKVPIDLRTHERAQLTEFTEKLVDHFDGIDDRADDLREVRDRIAEQDDTVFLTADQWSSLLQPMHDRLDEGLRTWWLQRKLLGRLQDRQEEIT